MENLSQVERIKIKLRLAKNTDAFFEVFGADSHRYRLDSPMKIEEINEFEKKYQIKLPKEYRTFLTEIGTGFGKVYNENGKCIGEKTGAGPKIGINKVEVNSDSYYYTNYLKEKVFFNSQMTKEEWEKETDKYYEEDIDTAWNRAYSGILYIGEQGCMGMIGIILNGNETGRVVYGVEEEEYLPELAEEKNFLDWYEKWLDKVISGESIKTVGHNFEETEKLIDRFFNFDKKVGLSYIRYHNSISKKILEILYDNYPIEKNEEIRKYMLNIFVKFDYENIKEELKKLIKEDPIEFLKMIHLYKPGRTKEWLQEIIEIYENTRNAEVKEYISYVTSKDDKDIKYII